MGFIPEVYRAMTWSRIRRGLSIGGNISIMSNIKDKPNKSKMVNTFPKVVWAYECIDWVSGDHKLQYTDDVDRIEGKVVVGTYTLMDVAKTETVLVPNSEG